MNEPIALSRELDKFIHRGMVLWEKEIINESTVPIGAGRSFTRTRYKEEYQLEA